MAVFIPNIGEKEVLMDILTASQLRLGLYKNNITPDGNTVFATLTEVDAEVDGYQTNDLGNLVVEDALTAAKWYVSTNSSNKAEAKYGAVDTYEEWVFNAADVANADTAYGVMMWTLTIDFTAGDAAAINVGDTVTDDGGETAIVTGVRLKSGAWGVDAAGTLCLKTQSDVFIAGDLNVGVTLNATIAGDTDKVLMAVEPFTAGQDIDTVGQKIQYIPVLTMATE